MIVEHLSNIQEAVLNPGTANNNDSEEEEEETKKMKKKTMIKKPGVLHNTPFFFPGRSEFTKPGK